VIRVGADYYLVASSFDSVPALPILHSRDLVDWKIVAYAANRLPFAPEPGGGVWAPSLRHHGGWFWIYFGDPDRGIFMTRARRPRSVGAVGARPRGERVDRSMPAVGRRRIDVPRARVGEEPRGIQQRADREPHERRRSQRHR